MKKLIIVICSAALVALGACKKNEEPAPTTEPAKTEAPAPTPAATTTATATAAAEENDGLEIEQDFEDKAEQEVTAQNLDAELDKVEKEIAAEK